MLSIIQAAGWPIWPLILCSVAALTIVIERLFSLRPTLIAPPELLEEVLTLTRSSLPGTDVVDKLAQNSLLGGVFATGLRAVIQEPRIAEDALRQAFESAGRIALHRLERYLNTLGTIAAVAPLLGLFGTVWGMILTFDVIKSQGLGQVTQLAGGISTALVTTFAGLAVGIPALVAHRFLLSQVDDRILELESVALEAVDTLRGDGPEGQGA